MKYAYSFSVWPTNKGWSREAYRLFQMLNGRIEMVFSAREFGFFRASLEDNGILLLEIERVPHCEPEMVP